jgi:L-ribulose-5-phosphate 3-epimerase
MTRRSACGILTAALAAGRAHAQQPSYKLPAPAQPKPPGPRKIPMLCVLSKALTGVWYAEIGEIALQLGFEGVDITMMPGGLVEPSEAPVDEVRALESVHGAGLEAPICTMGLTSPAEAFCRTLLALAGRTGVGLFKAGFNKRNTSPISRRDAYGLCYVGREYEIALNVIAGSGAPHSSLCSLAQAQMMIEGLDPRWTGIALHSECFGAGGMGDAELSGLLLQVKSVILGDFVLHTLGPGTIREAKPLGQGSVDFGRLFQLLARAGFTGPVTVEREYKASDEPGALSKDAEFVRKLMRGAYGAVKS